MAERTVVVRLKAVVDAYQKAMRDAAGETSKVTAAVTVLGQSGDDLKRVGDQMTKWVTVPLAAVGVGATKAASDFETTFSRMVGLANVPAGEVDKLRESVLGLAAQTGRGPQELAEALYYIRSSGVSAAQSMNVLEVAAKASAAGLGSTADIAKAVGFAVNAYGEQNLSASRATDILVAAVREGTIEAGALAPVMGRLIPTASALGIGFDQVAGTLAVMSRTGLDAEEAATSLSAVFSTMLGTSAAGKQLLDEHGLSLAKLRETAAGPGGVVAAMRMLDASFAGNDEALSTIIPNIRAFRAFMNVLAQDGAKVDGVLRAVSDSTGATDEAFGAFQSTNAAKLQKAFTEIKVALIQIGAALSPLASGLAQIAGPAAGAFGHLPDWLQSSVLGFVGLLAAIGPVSRIAGTLAANFDLLRSAASAALDKVALGAYNAAGSLSTLSIIGAGVTTVFVGLALQHAENERIAAELAATENALADAIRNAGSSVAGFEQKLRDAVAQDAPFAAMLAHAGVSTKDMAAALDQGGAAWDAMKAKLLAGAQAAGVSGQDLARLRVSLEYLPERAAAAKQHVEDAAAAIGDSGDQAGAAARGVDTLGSSMLTASDSAYTWEKALEGVQKQVSEMFARTFDVMDAQQGFADALDGVDTAAKQSSGSTRDLTSQQRTLERATRSVADAQRGLADAEANLARVRQGASARELQGASLGLREAQLGVAQAQQRVRDAQVRLNEARKSGDPNKVRQADLELGV